MSILYGGSAYATPPLSVQVHDHPMAVSPTHLYVMRHVRDNMGRYQAERSKTYILKLETKTSKLIEFHKLQDAKQGETENFSKVNANKDFNLFTYLETEKAFQIGLLKPRAHQKISIDKRKEFSLLSRTYSGQIDRKYQQIEEQSSIYDVNLRDILKLSLAQIISDYIGSIPDLQPNSEIHSVSQNFDIQSGGVCNITQVVNAPQPLSKYRHDIRSDEFIAHVNCRSAGDSLYIDAIVPLALKFNAKNKSKPLR